MRLNVQYIATMENIDTARGVSDIVPMQDLFNEWHAKNTNDKVRRIFQMSVSGLGPTQIAKKLRSEGAC